MLNIHVRHDYEDNEDEEQVLSVRPPGECGGAVQVSDGEFLPPKLKSWRVSQDWVIEAMQGRWTEVTQLSSKDGVFSLI